MAVRGIASDFLGGPKESKGFAEGKNLVSHVAASAGSLRIFSTVQKNAQV